MIDGVFPGWLLNRASATVTLISTGTQWVSMFAFGSFGNKAIPYYEENADLLQWASVGSYWQIVSENPFSESPNSLAVAPSGSNYSNGVNSSIVTPAITLSSTNVSFVINMSYSIESAYDYLKVYASKDGGAYSEISSYTGIATGYITYTTDLSSFMSGGTTLTLKFTFTSDSTNTLAGPKIDYWGIKLN